MSAVAPAFSPVVRVDAAPVIGFCGEVFSPQVSGALYWPALKTLLVADLHLEKLSSYARSGQLLPPYDTGMTLRRLAADVAATGAERVIALGDSFHRDEGVESLLPTDRATLAQLTGAVDWIWLAGNHDPAPHALGGLCAAELRIGGIDLRHVPSRGRGVALRAALEFRAFPPPAASPLWEAGRELARQAGGAASEPAASGQIAGHLHPAARVFIDGRSVRRPCFVHDGSVMILPAYGVTTGDINILSRAFSHLFNWEQLEVVMLGRDRLYPVSPKRLVGG